MSCPDQETTEVIGESVACSLQKAPRICCDAATLKSCADRIHKKTEQLCQRLYTLFTTHPHEKRLTYAQHAAQALRMAYYMGKGAVALCVHSIFPFLCKKTGTKIVEQIHDEIQSQEKKE